MANCTEMKEGDLFVCETCGLELQVIKACSFMYCWRRDLMYCSTAVLWQGYGEEISDEREVHI